MNRLAKPGQYPLSCVFEFPSPLLLTIMARENTQSQRDPTGKTETITFVGCSDSPLQFLFSLLLLLMLCFVIFVLTIMARENTQSQHDPTGKASALTFVKGSILPPFDNKVKYI